MQFHQAGSIPGRHAHRGTVEGTGLLKERTYIVYRVIPPGRKVPIGELVERRRAERANNTGDLLRLARKMYSSSTLDALEITVEPR